MQYIYLYGSINTYWASAFGTELWEEPASAFK
jgi:hypothetical protein